jgi:hypothetical protein
MVYFDYSYFALGSIKFNVPAFILNKNGLLFILNYLSFNISINCGLKASTLTLIFLTLSFKYYWITGYKFVWVIFSVAL